MKRPEAVKRRRSSTDYRNWLQEAKKASVQNRKDSEAALSQKQEKTAQQLHEAAPELAAMLAEKLLSEE